MLKNIYLSDRFFYLAGVCIFLFGLSFSFPILFIFSKFFLLVFLVVCIIDWLLVSKTLPDIDCSRKVTIKLSLGDPQLVTYTLTNESTKDLDITVIDELPYQLQLRDQIISEELLSGKSIVQDLVITPLIRGLYKFGDINLYVSNPRLGIVQQRKKISATENSEVYPSIIQMKKYELQVFSKTAFLSGIRKARKIGESDEFEHIRPYIQGDNIKKINWKATSRKNQLMINEYQNTRSQTIYCIIDKGRAMKMPFHDMTLLDHAINSSLVISNIILKKYDKVGLITFSNKIGAIVKASSKHGQLELISKKLYDQKTDFKEPSFELLFYTIRKQIQRRSIILMYSNFENMIEVDRNLPYLKSIAKKHLLVLILFINTEIQDAAEKECTSKSEIYLKTFADKAIYEKEKISQLLNIHGIQTILTKPEDLSVNVINKYLDFKNKRAQ